MASVKTYILAPNFGYKPSGAIQIGNIIADPLRPGKALSALGPEAMPPIETITETNHELQDEKGRMFKTGFWGQFLSTVGGDASIERDVKVSKRYDIAELETRSLRDEPCDNDPDLARRLDEPKVRAAIKAGLFGTQPVYLVTEVKNARGLSGRTEHSKKLGGGLGTTVPVTEGRSIGGEMRGEWRDTKVSAFTGGREDIVFAYQLHIIKQKGRKKGTKVGVFESEAALLHGEDDPGSETSPSDITVGVLDADELRKDDGLAIDARELTDVDGSTCVCISATYK